MRQFYKADRIMSHWWKPDPLCETSQRQGCQQEGHSILILSLLVTHEVLSVQLKAFYLNVSA